MKSYVGQTTRNFKTSVKEHISSYKTKTEKSHFAQHLLEENHSFKDDGGVEMNK